METKQKNPPNIFSSLSSELRCDTMRADLQMGRQDETQKALDKVVSGDHTLFLKWNQILNLFLAPARLNVCYPQI